MVLDWSRTDGLGLDRPRRLSGWTFARANALTVVLIVVVIGLMRAAGELRAVRVEAPVFVSILSGLAIGLAIWSAYALAFRALRRERALGLRGPSHRPPLRS